MDALLMNASTATSSKVLVEKRDGRVVDFDPINIISAVKSAFADLDKQVGPEEEKLIQASPTRSKARSRSATTVPPRSRTSRTSSSTP